MMSDLMERLTAVYTAIVNSGWLGFGIYILIGVVATLLLRGIFRRLGHNGKLPLQIIRIADNLLTTLLWCFIVIQGLRSVGVDVVGLLGAAGVAGIAIGFASQTALSNLISGIFIISERKVKIGDYVNIAGVEGTVESVHLLSIALRQPNNALVRIPCEAVLKSPVINITGDPLRRCDLDIGVDYTSDLSRVREVILEVIKTEPGLLDTPEPVVQFNCFADSSLSLHIGAWCKTSEYHSVRFRLADALLRAFRAKGVGIPFPTVTIKGK